VEVAVIILLLVVVVVVFLKKKSGGKPTKRSSKSKIQKRNTAASSKKRATTVNTFSAVSINCGKDACQSARTLENERFLVNEAPTFPLPGCDCSNCDCKYVHHTNRREQDEDRRASSSLKTNLFENSGNVERRTSTRKRRNNRS